MRPAMRRADRAVSEELARQFLAESEYLTLSMVDPDGLPYGVALSFAAMDGALYFHSAKEGYKCTCIGSGAPCCVTAQAYVENLPQHYTAGYRSAVAFGRVVPVTDQAEHDRALYAICDKYAPLDKEQIRRYVESAGHNTAVYRIDIESITGKENKR